MLPPPPEDPPYSRKSGNNWQVVQTDRQREIDKNEGTSELGIG